MSLDDLFDRLDKERETRTRRERHGRGELTFFNEMPISATGCTLPDGSPTDAECLKPRAADCDEARRMWTRRLPGTPLRRRGRLKVDHGKALLFFDEPEADFPLASVERKAVRPDLERDLGLSPRIRGLIRSDLFAMLLYGALCNTTWRHKATGTLCTAAGSTPAAWRGAALWGQLPGLVLLGRRRPRRRPGAGRNRGARLGAGRGGPADRVTGCDCRSRSLRARRLSTY